MMNNGLCCKSCTALKDELLYIVLGDNGVINIIERV